MESASNGPGAGGGTGGGGDDRRQAEQRGIWVLVAAVLAFAVLILPQVLEDDDGGALFAGKTPPRSGGPTAPGLPGPGVAGGPGTAGGGSADGGTGGTGGSWGASGGSGGAGTAGASGGSGSAGTSGGSGASGTSGGGTPAPPTRPTPPPDPTGEAFRAVRPGDCLAVYDTGQGRWSAQAPYRVGCGGGNALVQVSAVRSSSAGCPTGAGRSYWTYTSASGTTALCLTRQFHVGYCLLAEERGSGDGLRMHAGLMTAVDCEARRIPSQYDRILHITGVYAAPADANAAHCARVQGDRTRYFAWVVDGGRTLLCTMVFTG